jgi:hypothetical protein
MTPIETAVAPLKQKAIDSAEQYANQVIDKVCKDLEAHGWDINKAAPHPSYSYSFEGQRAKAKYNLYHSLTETKEGFRPTYRPGDVSLVQLSFKSTARYITTMMEMAAAQYESFVAKLLHKVGEHTDATLSTPTGVWDYSYVLITKADSETENWKTQCIGKYSKNGKYFHQWPTRKLVKGSKR